ncbi:1,4-alpha-glucan branching protein domain-containing protein [Paenibacillus marinisediminis]
MTTPLNDKTFPIKRGYASFILHAHLPYVRHKDEAGKLEERWFFEAMTETYIPLIDMFKRLKREGIPFRITMTLSPTLLALMEDSLLKERYEQHLLSNIHLTTLEVERLNDCPEQKQVAAMYRDRWQQWLCHYRNWDRDMIGQFRQYQELGFLELMTCAATHAYLPFIYNEKLVEAQIEIGVREHERHFGVRPRGIWLPECGYTPHLTPLLRKSGLSYFIVDMHGITDADPAPLASTLRPILVDERTYAFGRDLESSRQVWDSSCGYPGHPDYREYYRDIGYDLGWHDEAEWNYIKPYVLRDGTRVNTGLKYYRVTGQKDHKAWYDEDRARLRARVHARHFINSRLNQIDTYWGLHPDCEKPPLIVSPYDAELFGHWWFEGPLWIEMLFRELHADQGAWSDRLEYITPSDYIERYPDAERAHLPAGSWGRGGYSEVWLMQRNDWIYKHLHQAEDRLINTLNEAAPPKWGFTEVHERICNQAVRELMLAESSDWAFIMEADTVPSYAMERTKEHIMRCHTLLDMLEQRVYDEEQLNCMEAEYPCFPNIDYRLLLLGESTSESGNSMPKAAIKRVLMLAWEYPPLVIGGLSRAVYELSRHLAAKQCEVHVMTRDVPGSPPYEVMDGVHIYRVPVPKSETPIGFMDWVLQMNIAMIDGVEALMNNNGVQFDFVHAHDWLVYIAAKELKHTYNLPLITTIHATEYGRNLGEVHTDLQHRIHDLESELVRESEHIIVCSHAMVREVNQLFDVPLSRVTMIPNGVECAESAPSPLHHAADDGPVLFCIGRLVYEKGIHVLLHALPLIRQTMKHARLIIAGAGPMASQLKAIIHELMLDDCVHLIGFVDSDIRDKLFQVTDVCVFPSLYEPFGIVALEAMGAGIPVVVSDTGGLAEIIDHDRDGYKTPPGDVESLAWHTVDLLRDRDKAQRFSLAAARKVRSKYDWNTIAVSTRKIYEEVIAR